MHESLGFALFLRKIYQIILRYRKEVNKDILGTELKGSKLYNLLRLIVRFKVNDVLVIFQIGN